MTEPQKYINDLAAYLSPLAAKDRDDALEFYDEYIADAGLNTRKAIEEKLGTPRQLGHKILADYSIKVNDKAAKKGPASAKSSWRVFWWVLVAIITSPITLGLGIAVLAVLIGIGAAALGLIIGIIAMIGSIAVIAVVALYAGVTLLIVEPFSGLFYLGIGLTLIGLFLICVPLSYWLIRLIAQGIANFAKFLYNRIQARREAK
ncbi:DUF1700 domain-containing protein [Limosilactobacillus sp. STM2_1]|uniref:DUF1700 domain-containing protein n=1 Tax=Limosilactobacillus rudii TaxID=2759755 RepID=A0A7W3YPE0_9LACO|nr:DUF1700 domain-containing protein [Limosilactobacillus rudii]MBB1080405.1 DUF1700 domain-containing protein [Limosilactobacillus rudii]MBB1098431.1 DUF1700 domain-containing protein [Limosilactobacillus rudii]MCD7135439.1 DUF1700 domain-containing protein [Limosilactobacillus rudii]